MEKDRPLTAKQVEALKAAEDTLFGDARLVTFGCTASLKKRGLVEGDRPFVYLTDAGKDVRNA